MSRQIVVTGVKCEKCDGTGFEPCWEPVPCGGEPCSRCYQTGTTDLPLDLGSLPPAAIEADASGLYNIDATQGTNSPRWDLEEEYLRDEYRMTAGVIVTAFLSVLVTEPDEYKPPNKKGVRHHKDCLHDLPGVTICDCVPLVAEPQETP